VGKPYIDIQPGEDGDNRKVWMFPIRPVPDNDVKKPLMFVFKDMEDYKTRGKNVDAEYIKLIEDKKKFRKTPIVKSVPVPAPIPPKPVVTVPPEVVGKKIIHTSYGEGMIIGINGTSIMVSFSSVGEKKLGYEVCMNKKLIEFI
jgi:5-methylcytosine-specific restriction protein A